MIIVPFTEVCDIQGGTQPPKSEWKSIKSEGYIRMLQIRDFTQPDKIKIEYVKDNGKVKKCEADDILIGRYGASVGKILTGLSGAYNVAIVKTIPDLNRLDRGYLLYFLKSLYFQSYILGVGMRAAQAGFNKSDLKRLQIPLPPLTTQKKIAEVLDKADAIRKRSKKILTKYDQLAQSLFLEMFGDPVRNEKGWEVVRIKDLVAEVKYGTSSKAQELGDYPYLRMNNITYSGHMNYANLKYISVPIKDKEKYITRKGDILFNRTNSKELVGKTGLITDDVERIIAGYLIRVRTNELANPYYLWAHLNSKWAKLTLESMCKSIVGMANINAQELQKIKVLKAPIDLQNQFASIIEQIEKQKAQTQAELDRAETLYQSLLQRAFTGGLFPEISNEIIND
jgi:type I restriction enzyme S subunit